MLCTVISCTTVINTNLNKGRHLCQKKKKTPSPQPQINLKGRRIGPPLVRLDWALYTFFFKKKKKLTVACFFFFFVDDL